MVESGIIVKQNVLIENELQLFILCELIQFLVVVLQQGADLLEVGMVGSSHQVKHDRLRCGENNTSIVHTIQCNSTIMNSDKSLSSVG